MILTEITLTELSLSHRFRTYLPVVIDIETGGFHAQKNALLEVAAVTLDFDKEKNLLPVKTYHEHIEVEPGMEVDDKSLEFIGMDPYNPLRFAISEKEALERIFNAVRKELKKHNCQRAFLVGHNAWFDLSFINAAAKRQSLKTPFHEFTCMDTATLGAVFCGQTVLARIAEAINIAFDPLQAHSAKYDAMITADVFCYFVNFYRQLCSLQHKTHSEQ